MKAFLISDNHDSLVGMRLAGIEGVEAHDAEEADRAVREAMDMEELGVLVITEKVASLIPEVVLDMRERGGLPLLVEIPDRHGTQRGPDFLTRYVREAIGVKIE